MTKAFADATCQEFHVYYAEDSVAQPGSRQRKILTGNAAEDAWNAEIKSDAHDLTGRLALVVGMPIIVVDNVAVEIGISNGARGTLTGISYYISNNRRYAASVDVHLPSFSNPDPNAANPNIVTLSTISGP
ncbi:hypothetical protein K435DRAFT_600133, partial [Dendrothele bispora CBS 962.96]